MAGPPPLRLLLYLPPRLLAEQGRVDSVSKLSQVLRSCPSCRGLLVLSRDRDRHGNAGSPGTSPRSSFTVPPSGSWYCSKCGIHLVPQLPGDNLSSPSQARPWTSPIDRGRSPQGSHEDIKGSQTSLRKDPTSPLGSIPLSPGKILDEHYDEWERNIQASMTSMLQQMRGHFGLKSHQLKKLQVDLCQRERALRVREETYTDHDQRIREGEEALRSKAERLQIYKDVMMSQLEAKSRQLLKLHRKYHGNDLGDFNVNFSFKGDDGISLTNGNISDILNPTYRPAMSSQNRPANQELHRRAHSGQVWRDSLSQRHSGASSEQSQHGGARKPARDSKTDMNRSWHYSTDELNDSDKVPDTKVNMSLQFEPGTDKKRAITRQSGAGKPSDSEPRPFVAFLNRSPQNSANPGSHMNLAEPQVPPKAPHAEMSNTKRYPRQYIRDLYTGNNSNSVQNSPHSTLTSTSNISQQGGPSQKISADSGHQGLSRWSSGYQYGRPVASQTSPSGPSHQNSPDTSQYDHQRSPQYTTQKVPLPSMPNPTYRQQVSPRHSYASPTEGQHSPKQTHTTANQYNVTRATPQYTMTTHRTPHNQYNILSIANPQGPISKPQQRPPYSTTRQVPSGGQYRNYNGVDAHLNQNSMDSSRSSHGSVPPPPYSPNGVLHSKRSPRRVTEI